MEVTSLNNAIQVSHINLEDDKDCEELGWIVADNCVVYVDQKVSEARLAHIQDLWGQPCKILISKLLFSKKLTGRHWRPLLVHSAYAQSNKLDKKTSQHMARVSFEKDKKGRPIGLFTNGELNWHSDQHAFSENQRVVGLMSLWGTENSQTNFLNTAPAYAALKDDDRSMVDELMSVYEWDGGTMCDGLIPEQKKIMQYSFVPLPGMETPLKDSTASGVKGIRFPSHCFSHFRGMSKPESLKFKNHLWSLINRPEYIYEHKWKDGEIVFMDQNITLHARPTNVQYGNSRTLIRNISFLDKLFPNKGPIDFVRVNGEKLNFDEFAVRVDAFRRAEFEPV